MARRPSYQTTAATSPASEGVIGNGAAYPQVLDPEHGPQSIHRSDLFFINSTPQMNTRQNAEFSQRSPNAASPSISNQLYPYHQQAFHHFTPPAPAARPPQSFYAQPLPSYTQRPLTDLSPPPVPPKPKFKPIVYPPIKTTTNYDQYAAAPPPPLPPLAPAPPVQSGEITASPTDDSNELAMALALSQSESIERQKLQEELRNQEEEDLARALAESMLSTGSNINPSVDPFFTSPPERVISSSGTTVDDPGTATSPARAPVDLPSQSSQNATSTAHPTPSSNPTFPEFGRHDKWRLPGLSDRPQEEDSAPEVQSEPMGRKSPTTPSFPSSFNDATPVTARPRPSSISSVSSLPYTLPDPEPQTQRGGRSNRKIARTVYPRMRRQMEPSFLLGASHPQPRPLPMRTLT
ncbi:hypothetical protein BDZ97DRAFT_1210 [Flammula alnicola]|nr:hypothetical protein BDZ97DRAFT_1210 [Flammula alnicola]